MSFNHSINQYMKELFPNEQTLKEIDNLIENDRESMNEVFNSYNEEGFSKINNFKEVNLDLEKIVFSLAQQVIKNSVQINNMENNSNMKNINND